MGRCLDGTIAFLMGGCGGIPRWLWRETRRNHFKLELTPSYIALFHGRFTRLSGDGLGIAVNENILSQ
jgi:hypothetical protein